MLAAQALKLLRSGRDGVMRWNSERPRKASERPSLAGAELRDLDLTRADLSDLDLSGADLRGSCLRKATLRNAKLGGACLRDCDLREAEFSLAKLVGADLRGANLREAELSCLDLADVDLRAADLSFAYLCFSGFEGAQLRGAKLVGADLRDARLAASQFAEATTDGQTHAPVRFVPVPEPEEPVADSASENQVLELRLADGPPASLRGLATLHICLASLVAAERRLGRPVEDADEFERILGVGDARMRKARLSALAEFCDLSMSFASDDAGRWRLTVPAGLLDRCCRLYGLPQSRAGVCEWSGLDVWISAVDELCAKAALR